MSSGAASAAATLMAPSTTSPQMIPPLVHALGGALGSALALLLLYPLERTRIEMQSLAAARQRQYHSTTPLLAKTSTTPTITTNLVKREEGVLKASPINALTDGHDDTNDGRDQLQDSKLDAKGRIIDSRQAGRAPISSATMAKPTASNTLLSTPEVEPPLSLLSCMIRVWQKNELYRGVAPIVATLATSNFCFFFVNEWMKRWLLVTTTTTISQRPGQFTQMVLSSRTRSLLASTLAGICNVLLTNPLWVANMRIVSGEANQSTVWGEIWNVIQQYGFRHLWTGTQTSILLVSNPVINFFAYEQFKAAQLTRRSSSHPHYQQGTLGPLEAFLTGALSKAVATILTYPLQLTQAILRLQTRSPHGRRPTTNSGSASSPDTAAPLQYQGMVDCLVQLYRRDGLAGLFTGMRAKLLQTVLTSAFTFLTYEQLLGAVHAAHQTLMSKKLAAAL